jgi:hypothetical protein
VGALGVLSRADEVFGGDLSAMDDARRVSGVLRGDRRIRGLCQDVVPVAGLVAESAATLRNDEVEALRAIAGADPGRVAFGVSSVDRFRDLDHAETTPETRMRLLERFGLFGVRAAIDVLGRDPTRTGDALSSDLLAVSGIGELRAALDRIVLQRVHELRARVVLRRLASSPSLLGDRAAAGELERIQANAHGLRELEVAELLRRGSVPGIGPDDNAELQRLVGVYGVAVRDRLAAPPGAGRDELRSLAGAQHGRWQRVAESPLAAPVTVQVASTAVRTCEAMLMSDLAPA